MEISQSGFGLTIVISLIFSIFREKSNLRGIDFIVSKLSLVFFCLAFGTLVLFCLGGDIGYSLVYSLLSTIIPFAIVHFSDIFRE